MHTLIVGERGIGKSTLIRKVLEELQVSPSGFRTRKENHLADAVHGSPIYFYEVGKPEEQTPDNLIGYCKDQHPEAYAEAFDRMVPKVEAAVKDSQMILMDEVGFMEASSEKFSSVILSVLDGETPVIAAVKHKKIPFLEAVRNHPNCRCFYITEENRDELYLEVLEFVKEQLEK